MGVITALPDVELPAVLKAFDIDPSKKEDEIKSGYRYWYSSFKPSKCQDRIRVVITSIGGSGNIASNDATIALIQNYNPGLLLFVGIAAGLRSKVKLLDVVISEKVIGYESVKLTKGKMQLRPQIEHPPYEILQDVHFFTQQIQGKRWIQLFNKLQNGLEKDFLPSEPIRDMPKMHIGSIASGEKLLADGSLEKIRDTYDERILAGEMEGIGFAVASEKNRVPWLIIRGISDFGDPATRSGRLKDKFHHPAANAAASWARIFLEFGYSCPDVTKNNIIGEEDKELKLCDSIIDKIQSLIAIYGLDDEHWAQAISSQYFLIGLAHILDLTGQKDYLNLLDRFLESFHYNIREELILDKEHMLVTPKETEKIIQSMKDEDKNDNYYTKSEKMKAENINATLMHNNYHYGLTLMIASSEKLRVLENIKKISINRLTSNESLDDYGGWYPYRVPWITARILFSLKEAGISEKDKNGIEVIIQRSLISLIRRIYKGKYWRSGVGTWVSEWESTALCLEALNKWDFIKENENKIKSVVGYVIEKQDEWLIDPPEFSDEESSNKTLSSITMSSVLLRVIINNFTFKDFSIDGGIQFLHYFDKSLKAINADSKRSVRQYCTIPQILYYIATAVSKYKSYLQGEKKYGK